MMPRLVKIDKKESPKSASNLRQNTGNSTRERIPGWRLKKSVERRVTKRIPATHNFMYEFDPLGNPKSSSNDATTTTTTKDTRNVTNAGQGDSPLKLPNAHQNSNNVRTRMASVLPKLHPRSDTELDFNLNRRENIPKHERNVERPVTSRDRRRKRNPTSEIDREVEKAKSDWQALRSGSGWTQGKHFANPRTRKLYDTLEKMTHEINEIQKSYLDPKSNQYLQRGAMKTLNRSELSFEEKAGKIKDIVFPKESKKLVNEGMTSVSSSVIKSSLSNVHANKELHLEKYIDEAEKNVVNKEEPPVKEDVTEMLAKLNMNSFDIYNIPSDGEDSSLQSAERVKSIRMHHSTRLIVDEKIRNEKVKERREVGLSPKMDDRLMRYNDITNSDSSVQTNTKAMHGGDRTFLEMGLHSLNNNFPRNTLSRVLQSEYLKKDGSLKPM